MHSKTEALDKVRRLWNSQRRRQKDQQRDIFRLEGAVAEKCTVCVWWCMKRTAARRPGQTRVSRQRTTTRRAFIAVIMINTCVPPTWLRDLTRDSPARAQLFLVYCLCYLILSRRIISITLTSRALCFVKKRTSKRWCYCCCCFEILASGHLNGTC